MQNHKQSPRPYGSPVAAEHRTWEYQVTTVTGSTEVLRAELDSAGALGFELVTCQHFGGQRPSWVVVLKRPAGAA
jgi:hypothetical protein